MPMSRTAFASGYKRMDELYLEFCVGDLVNENITRITSVGKAGARLGMYDVEANSSAKGRCQTIVAQRRGWPFLWRASVFASRAQSRKRKIGQ